MADLTRLDAIQRGPANMVATMNSPCHDPG